MQFFCQKSILDDVWSFIIDHLFWSEFPLFQLVFPNQDIEPKKFAADCWTLFVSNLGDLLLVEPVSRFKTAGESIAAGDNIAEAGL